MMCTNENKSVIIKLNKNGSSPATNDVVGNLDFISEDSGNNVTTYGRIQSTIVDVNKLLYSKGFELVDFSKYRLIGLYRNKSI